MLGLVTFLQWLQTLEGDLELIGITEFCWVVEDVDAQERYDRHLEQVVLLVVMLRIVELNLERNSLDVRGTC